MMTMHVVVWLSETSSIVADNFPLDGVFHHENFTSERTSCREKYTCLPLRRLPGHPFRADGDALVDAGRRCRHRCRPPLLWRRPPSRRPRPPPPPVWPPACLCRRSTSPPPLPISAPPIRALPPAAVTAARSAPTVGSTRLPSSRRGASRPRPLRWPPSPRLLPAAWLRCRWRSPPRRRVSLARCRHGPRGWR